MNKITFFIVFTYLYKRAHGDHSQVAPIGETRPLLAVNGKNLMRQRQLSLKLAKFSLIFLLPKITSATFIKGGHRLEQPNWPSNVPANAGNYQVDDHHDVQLVEDEEGDKELGDGAHHIGGSRVSS